MLPDQRSRNNDRLSAIIIGGGITGLSTAWYLEKLAREDGTNLSIVLVERENGLGGKISTLREDGFVVEAGPDGFLTRKPWAMDLANELGLSEDIVYMQAMGASLLVDGKLHRIPPGLMGPAPASRKDVWSASFLSWRGKLRASLEPLVGKRKAAGRESLGAFLRRRMGAELTDTLLEPLTAGIYGSDSYDMSLDALFPILEEWEERYGSITRGMRESKKAARGSNPPPSAFFSFDGGAYRIVQAVADSLEKTEIIRGRAAVAVNQTEEAHPPRYRVTLDDARSFESDVVVLATPAQDAGTLVGSFAPGLGRLLERMRSSPTGSVSMAFRREDVTHPLDGSGFLAPRSEAGLVAGCTWTSSKWPGRSPGEYVLLRAFLGSAKGRSFLEHSDEDLIAAATETLQPLLGIRGAPGRAWVHRWAEGMPQYKVDHTEWLDGVERELAGHQGLFLCGASYRGIGVPDCVRQGRDTAERIHSFALRSAGRTSTQPLNA